MKMQIAERGIAKNPEWRLRASLLQFIARNFDCEVPDMADTADPNENRLRFLSCNNFGVLCAPSFFSHSFSLSLRI